MSVAAQSTHVDIHYTRLPARTTIFTQQLVHRTADCIITFMQHTDLPAPVRAGDRIILEPGAPVVWFTFPGAWHDIGRFHTADGVFTGCYANILTPVELLSLTEWSTTDLALDVWLGADGAVELLDAPELEDALAAGWVTSDTGATARAEATRLMAAARAGVWPPAVVHEWTLERALSTVSG